MAQGTNAAYGERVCRLNQKKDTGPLTFKHGANLPDTQATLASKLSKGEFHEEEGDPTEHQHDEIGEHESTWRQEKKETMSTGK